MNTRMDVPVRAELSACPCCGHELGPVFYEVGPVPVHSCLMLDTAEEAMAFPQSTVRLSLCEGCGFVTNRAFDPHWSAYAPNYEDQQSFSPTFNSFAGSLARDLVEKHRLEGKSAVEIGCSKGDFLALLCEAGMAVATGIDPSAVEGRVAPPSRGTMRLVPEYYGEAHLALDADLLCCRHTLEHIQPVAETLALMRRHMEGRPGAVLCIEVPDATRIWQDCAFEDIYYEHCSYFTPGSLARAVRRAGFAVTDLRREYGNQYLVLEASLDPRSDRSFEIEETVPELVGAVTGFSKRVSEEISAWKAVLENDGWAGRTAIWGSGSKCVSFIRTLAADIDPDLIVDINPHRTGKHAPGLPIAIQSPEALLTAKSSTIVVMNAMYVDEISRTCDQMGLSARLIALGKYRPGHLDGTEEQ